MNKYDLMDKLETTLAHAQRIKDVFVYRTQTQYIPAAKSKVQEYTPIVKEAVHDAVAEATKQGNALINKMKGLMKK